MECILLRYPCPPLLPQGLGFQAGFMPFSMFKVSAKKLFLGMIYSGVKHRLICFYVVYNFLWVGMLNLCTPTLNAKTLKPEWFL